LLLHIGVVAYILPASEADVHAVHQPHEHQHISLSVEVHERGVTKLIVGDVICLGTPDTLLHILVTERSSDLQVTAPWNWNCCSMMTESQLKRLINDVNQAERGSEKKTCNGT